MRILNGFTVSQHWREQFCFRARKDNPPTLVPGDVFWSCALWKRDIWQHILCSFVGHFNALVWDLFACYSYKSPCLFFYCYGGLTLFFSHNGSSKADYERNSSEDKQTLRMRVRAFRTSSRMIWVRYDYPNSVLSVTHYVNITLTSITGSLSFTGKVFVDCWTPVLQVQSDSCEKTLQLSSRCVVFTNRSVMINQCWRKALIGWLIDSSSNRKLNFKLDWI